MRKESTNQQLVEAEKADPLTSRPLTETLNTPSTKRFGLFIGTFFRVTEAVRCVAMSDVSLHGAEAFLNYHRPQDTTHEKLDHSHESFWE